MKVWEYLVWVWDYENVFTECIIRRLGETGLSLEEEGGEGWASSDAKERKKKKEDTVTVE